MWQLWAATAMACFAVMQLLFAALVRRGIDVAAVLLYVFGVGALFYLIHVRATRAGVPRAPRELAMLVAAAALSYIGNWLLVRAVATAPNPGYPVAISGLQAALVTLASVAVLGATLSWSKAAGVALCAIGVTLLVR
ncbi:MAG TPA: EamA family transporter [Vicinamibacterales bacterium]|nr:EamA family transporter [Vicinamibacterales bacterium]